MKISYKPVDSDYQVVIKKDYDSWASSLYSPEGFFKYEFPMSEFQPNILVPFQTILRILY